MLMPSVLLELQKLEIKKIMKRQIRLLRVLARSGLLMNSAELGTEQIS